MKRRDFLKTTGAFIISPASLTTRNFGWRPSDHPGPSLFQVSKELKGFGENKVSCLWEAWKKIKKTAWEPHDQVGNDCVAQASGSAVDLLTCTRIIIEKKKEAFLGESSTDLIYSGGRILIAKQKNIEGMEGNWAVSYLKEYGNLLRIIYNIGKEQYDLRPYNYNTYNHWKKTVPPISLQEESKKHSLIESVLVSSWEEVRDAVSAGYPVIFCSYLGANNDQRDQDGFIKPSGRWAHAWCLAGVQDGKRPGACLLNSHGPSFGKGPKTFNQPEGSVWIDAEHINRSLRQFADSYALTNYNGFPVPQRDYILWQS